MSCPPAVQRNNISLVSCRSCILDGIVTVQICYYYFTQFGKVEQEQRQVLGLFNVMKNQKQGSTDAAHSSWKVASVSVQNVLATGALQLWRGTQDLRWSKQSFQYFKG